MISFRSLLMIFGMTTSLQAADDASVKNIDAAEAYRLATSTEVIIVLDVRTPEEFTAGHIAGAKNINFYNADFNKKIGSLDKDKSYLVHCAVGGRSAKVRRLMKDLKFKMIYHLEGGMKAWEKAGKPVKR